jgi:putative membrane protein
MASRELNKNLIIVLSIAVPLVVAVLFRIPPVPGYDFSFLPPIYATLNGITAVLLVVSVASIKRGKKELHQKLNLTCMALSAAFLVMYVLYHITSAPTPFGGTGWVRGVYFFVLISHIGLSVLVIPLVLFTFARAWAGDFERHKQLAKFTFPIWLYVAVTGVIVYVMISPYYI